MELEKGQPIGFFVVEPCTLQNKGKKGEEKLQAEKQEGRQDFKLFLNRICPERYS